MNPEEMKGGVEGAPDQELLVQELELINNELIANNASNHLDDAALAEKLRRQEELKAMIANG